MVRPFYNQSYNCCNDVKTIVLYIQAPVRASRDSTFRVLDILFIEHEMFHDIKADVGLLHSS